MKQLSHIALRYGQIKLRSPSPRALKRHCHVAFARFDLVIREGYLNTSKQVKRQRGISELVGLFYFIEDEGGGLQI